MSTFPNGVSNASAGPSGGAQPAAATLLLEAAATVASAAAAVAGATAIDSVVTDNAVGPVNGKPTSTGMLFGFRRTGLAYTAKMKQHWRPDRSTDDSDDSDDEDDFEPERPARISRVWKKLGENGLLQHAEHVAVRLAAKEEIMLAHSEAHWDRIRHTSMLSQDELVDRIAYYQSISLFVNSETFTCARLAAGGVIELCHSVAEGRIRNGFAVVRPPGHHCEPQDPSGFCVFNNISVAAKWLQTVYPEKYKKILIFDWDVHHGNGTQRSFYYDPNVLFISIHRYLDADRRTFFYPGSDWGSPERVGELAGEGFNVNIGWPEAGVGDNDYIYAMQRVVMPIAMEFNPDFVLVSAGYDAALGDMLGLCRVTPQGFAHMTYMISSLANGNVVLALEGGYNLESVANSATECIKVLMGESPPAIPAMVASAVGTETVDDALRVQSKYWKTLPQYVPRDEAQQSEGPVIPLADVLCMHRTWDLYHSHELCTVPIADELLKPHYENHVLCSLNVYTADTLVLFVHDLGNVRNEVPTFKADVQVENAYLLDTNRVVNDWLKEQGWGIIDVSILPKPSVDQTLQTVALNTKADQRKLMKRMLTWIWGSLIALADCRNVVFVGLGEGCDMIGELLNYKLDEIKPMLRASVSLPGMGQIPAIKVRKEHAWYRDLSFVLLPSTHPVLASHTLEAKELMKHGNVKRAEHVRPTTILLNEWPRVGRFVLEKVRAAEAEHATSDGPNAMEGVLPTT